MGMPRRFFYNRRFMDAASRINTYDTSRHAYDLCTILTHELGHVCGFGPELASVRVGESPFPVEEGARLNVTVPVGGALLSVSIYDMRGRLVDEIPARWYHGGVVTLEVPISGAPGVHFCVVEINGERSVRSIIVP